MSENREQANQSGIEATESAAQGGGGETSEDVLRRNIEGSRRIIEAKRRASAAAGGPEPRPEDEAQNGPTRPPGHADVPEGGSSGSEMNLGGGYKSEPRH